MTNVKVQNPNVKKPITSHEHGHEHETCEDQTHGHEQGTKGNLVNSPYTFDAYVGSNGISY
jgi:hypothetical protein